MFDDCDLAARLESLSEKELDELPFGVIRLGDDDTVVSYNATEARQSGYRDKPRIGLDFFVRVAPCMNTEDFRGHIDAGRRQGTLDMEFGWRPRQKPHNHRVRCWRHFSVETGRRQTPRTPI